MVLEYNFSFRHFNLPFLTPKKREKVIKKVALKYTKAVKIFEYRKNNNSY